VGIIGVLLSMNSIGCGGIVVNGCECRTEENACQYKSLYGKFREGRHIFITEDQSRWGIETLQLTAMLPANT
jgi:hypothetical protein